MAELAAELADAADRIDRHASSRRKRQGLAPPVGASVDWLYVSVRSLLMAIVTLRDAVDGLEPVETLNES
ncbi:MAG: hypothetical protein HOP29_07285 [Phycisphaerales bacterium]|nr:hypothetical protein [Phycisphaerales bacterium]